MPTELTHEQEVLHRKAMSLSRQYRQLEWPIIETLLRVGSSKLYLKFEVTSLFQYAVAVLGLSEPVAYSFITLGRKCEQVPELRQALQNKVLSAGKASRIVAAISRDNADELINFAKKRSRREIDQKVAELNPKLAVRERAKPVAADVVELRTGISKQTYELLSRSQALLAQKLGKNPDIAETLEFILADFVSRQDPVQKAERAKAKATHAMVQKLAHKPKPAIEGKAPESNPTRQLCPDRVAKSLRRPLSAADKHLVHARDGGRCTHVDSRGHRCENDRWIQIHHIRPVSLGGSNEPENLTTLCSIHHDLVHQLSLPLEGQVTWLRSPIAQYSVEPDR